ncbi:MAG: hypothetical protein K9J17_02180 [Flavobacteriales bacterium]|nr:hypothetical protein [Flavobacteriales bacterium]
MRFKFWKNYPKDPNNVMKRLVAIILVIVSLSASAQAPFWYPDNLHWSNEAEIGMYPCMDTMKVFGFKYIADIGLILPSWRPVANHDSVTVLEGQIMPIDGHEAYKFGVPHVSFEDLPLFHYTHDFSFNVFPDRDYRNVLSRYIQLSKDDDGNEIRDTIVRDWVHCEWESGLAAGNRGNKYADVCRAGGSAGFSTAGHERYDIIWNWPTAGDWVHVEGLWIWDRGHPPAKTEIHPMRFMATRRNLPDKILSEKGDSVFATRVDLYASGDGSAFYNNQDTNTWTRSVKMSSKDYIFLVKHTLPRPSSNAVMKWQLMTQKGNTFSEEIHIKLILKGDTGFAQVSIPWKSNGVSDTAVLGQTLFLYWDEGNGVPETYRIHSYKVNLEKLKIRRLSEIFFLTPAELRMFADVGGQYIFLNEHVSEAKDILRKGIGRTIKKNWKINKSFMVHVPEDRQFRVYVGGWEADGTDKVLGHIVDQNAPCSSALKNRINDLMLDPTPVGYGGCEDDNMGESIVFHSPLSLQQKEHFMSSGDGNPYKENCPLGHRTPVDFHRLEYSITEK